MFLNDIKKNALFLLTICFATNINAVYSKETIDEDQIEENEDFTQMNPAYEESEDDNSTEGDSFFEEESEEDSTEQINQNEENPEDDPEIIDFQTTLESVDPIKENLDEDEKSWEMLDEESDRDFSLDFTPLEKEEK